MEGRLLLRGRLLSWGRSGSGAMWCRDQLLEVAGDSVLSANQEWGVVGLNKDVDPLVSIWNLDPAEPRLIRRFSAGSGNDFAIENNGSWLAKADRKSVTLWRLRSDGEEFPPYILTQSEAKTWTSVAFSRDGRWLAAMNESGSIRLWRLTGDSRSEPLLFSMDPDGSESGLWMGYRVTFTADSQWLVWIATTVNMWPLDAETWVDLACRIVGRPLTPNEMMSYSLETTDFGTCD